MSVCARAGLCVCEGGGGGGEGWERVLSIFFFFPSRIQYRSESNIDMIFSILSLQLL